MTFRAFDLFEGLDIFVLGAVHDGKDFGDEVRFIAGPVAACAGIQRFHMHKASASALNP